MRAIKSKKLVYKIRQYFISGLLVWLPIWVTIILVSFIVNLLDRTLILLPARYHIIGLGAVMSIIIIFLTGLLVGNYIGNYLLIWWENLVSHIPLVRTIHTSVKDVLKTFVHPEGKSFKKVFLVEFPRKNMWSVGFQTDDGIASIEKSLERKSLVSLFIPTTPNITSGFLIIVPKEELTELDMPIDQALKYVISLGVVQPEAESTTKKI